MATTLSGIGITRSLLELLGIVFVRFRPVPRIWVAWLVGVNTASLLFIEHIEAQVALAVVGIALLAQAMIYQRKRFIRLLGLTHFVWVPMLSWIALRLGTLPEGEGLYHAWLVTLIVTNTFCLAIDTWDATRFILGDRHPYYAW